MAARKRPLPAPVALGIIALNLVVLSVLSWKRAPEPARPLAFGDVLPAWTGETPEGRPVGLTEHLAGRWGLVLYAHRSLPEPLARYVSILVSRYGEQNEGLRAILVVGPEHRAKGEVSGLPVGIGYGILLDDKGTLRRSLGLAPHSDRTLVVAPDGHLVLSADGLIGRDELRQHVEKHVTGSIQYAPSVATYLGEDAALPSYPVIGLSEDAEAPSLRKYRPSSGSTVVVLPASVCATCNNADLFDRIVALRGALCSESSQSCPMELLVTAGYPATEVLWQLNLRGVRDVPVFQATDTLRGLEDDYFTKRQGPADALVLTMGDDSRVESISPLRTVEAGDHVGS